DPAFVRRIVLHARSAPGRVGAIERAVLPREPRRKLRLKLPPARVARVLSREGPEEVAVLVDDLDDRDRRVLAERDLRVRVWRREEFLRPIEVDPLHLVVEEEDHERSLPGIELEPERKEEAERCVDPLLLERMDEMVEVIEPLSVDRRVARSVQRPVETHHVDTAFREPVREVDVRGVVELPDPRSGVRRPETDAIAGSEDEARAVAANAPLLAGDVLVEGA